MGSLTILNSGLLMTVQDAGRLDYRAAGVPHSGAMDATSMQLANNLLDNAPAAAVIEMTLAGGYFLFTAPTAVCITGAQAIVLLNTVPVAMDTVVTIATGDNLKVLPTTTGNFTYLGIKDGFVTVPVLGSKSFYNGVTKQSVLKKGDQLPYNAQVVKNTSATYKHSQQQHPAIKALSGPEFYMLNRQQQVTLLTQSFTVSTNWSRMAFELKGTIENKFDPIASSPVLPGTVQLTPDGTLIVLMRDGQTTGGYPRVLQLTDAGIDTLAQCRVGGVVDFVMDML